MTSQAETLQLAQPSAVPLLSAKMSVPAIRGPVLVRQQLLDTISRGVAFPLTVVTGAPGAGKTYLLASWVAAGVAPGPVAWVRLEPADDEPGAFWAYVVESLRRAGLALQAVGLPMRADDVDRSFLARLAEALATQPEPVVLVLDQFDVVSARAIVDGLRFVLRNAEPTLRLVLLSRTLPRLSTHRHRLAGEVTQLEAADLAFTTDEAAQLLRQHGVRLTPDALAALTDYTKGWAAGLRLSAIAMQRRVDPGSFVARLPAEPTVADYLVDEVLETQSSEVREFLLQTSVTDRLCPELANALTDRSDAEVVLTGLVSGNVLTEVIEEAPSWYAYHPLFSDVLRTELRRERPDRVPELHRRAAAWYDAADFVPEAVHHAVAAGDWQRAAGAVVRNLAVDRLLAGRQTTHLAHAFATLPPDEPGAAAAIVRAACAAARFDRANCRAQLDRAETLLADADQGDDDTIAALASVAVIRAMLDRVTGDVDSAERAGVDGDRCLAQLPDRASAHPQLRALLLSSVGSAQLWAGRFGEAERTLRAGLDAANEPGCEYPRLNILGRLAGVEFRNGRLRRAAQLGQAALELGESCGLPVQYRTGAAHVTLAMVALEWNDRAAARQHLDNAEKTVGARHDPLVATVVTLLRAWQYAAGRDYRRAFAALAQLPDRVGELPGWIGARVTLTEAAIHLRRGDTDAAAATLERADERDSTWLVTRAAIALAAGDRAAMTRLLTRVVDESDPVDASRIDGWLLRAHAAYLDGDRRGAVDALRHALKHARPEGHRRPFTDAGPWLRDLLKATPELAAEHQWLGPPLVPRAAPAARRAPAGDDPPAALVEPLTERERAVLALAAQAKSTDDIAAELFVSVNTVKTHQKSIYRKLAVSRRTDAVRRGRLLGLV